MKIQVSNYSYKNQQVFRTNQPTFGIKIPKLENAIDTYISKAIVSHSDNVNLVKTVKAFADKIFNHDNLIGSGCYNFVYDLGKYVLRIPKNINPKEIKISDTIEKNINNIDMKTYYGAPLLNIGNIQILKNIGEHTPCGVPYNLIKNMKYEDIIQYYFTRYFPKITNVPQEAFDKFAQDVSKIDSRYTIDFFNPNNTVITKDNNIAFTDDLLQCSRYCGENSIIKMLKIFMLDASKGIYVNSYDKHLDKAGELFKKILLAGEKANLPFSCSKEDSILLKDALSKIKANIECDDLCEKINDIHRKQKNSDVRLKEMKQLIDNIY